MTSQDFLFRLWEALVVIGAMATGLVVFLHLRIPVIAEQFRKWASISSFLILVENLCAVWAFLFIGEPPSDEYLATRVIGRAAFAAGMTCWALFLMQVIGREKDDSVR